MARDIGTISVIASIGYIKWNIFVIASSIYRLKHSAIPSKLYERMNEINEIPIFRKRNL